MNTLPDTLQYLYSLKNRGIKLNLDRVHQFDGQLEHPWQSYPAIHVAGTNGKGSVTHYLAAMLEASGLRTGLYTSPHLVRFNERVLVNGRSIPDHFILNFIEEWRPTIDALDLTYFEATTLMAMEYFRQQQVDVAVLETGLGGRLDATNIVTPLVSVITSIGLEHTDQLGETISAVAGEKAGIIKPQVPVVVGKVPAEAGTVISERASELESPVIFTEEMYDPEIRSLTIEGTAFSLNYHGTRLALRMKMLGKQVISNATIALAALEHQDRFHLTWDQMAETLSDIQIPGRLQLLGEYPLVLYDVAHNADSFRNLWENLQAVIPGGRFAALMCVGVLKDINSFPGIIPDTVELGVMTLEEMPMHPYETWQSVFGSRQIQDFGSGSAAVRKFLDRLDEEMVGIITGSHYIAEDVYRVMNFSLDS